MHDILKTDSILLSIGQDSMGKQRHFICWNDVCKKEYLVLSLSFEAVDEYFETQLYDMFLAELAVNNKLYMEIMIRNLWKRMDENYFYYFNKKKKTGIQELNYNGKKIIRKL